MTGFETDRAKGGRASLTLEDALARVEQHFTAIAGSERLSVSLADGRIAAEDVFARNPLPPFDNAAVDGYALRHADLALEGPTRLPVAGRIPAGASAQGLQAEGRAYRIFTGAPIPAAADTVVMQEVVTAVCGAATLPPGIRRGANVRRAGEDIALGALVIAKGSRLKPQDLALAAATGHADLVVHSRPRVALFSTGDELAEPGAALQPGMIHDSNRVMLGAMLGRLGAIVEDLGVLRDDPAALPARLAQAAEGRDLVLTSGGVSVGEEDHVRAAVEAVGHLDLWRLAIKPGRPLAMGRIGQTPFVGLPGNPVAAYVTLLFVVRPLLARLSGARIAPPVALSARAAFRLDRQPGRREFLRVALRIAEDGSTQCLPAQGKGAASLLSLTSSDALAEIAEDVTVVAPGDVLRVYPHALLW